MFEFVKKRVFKKKIDMKNKKILVGLIFLLIGLNQVDAQEAVVASGGEAAGSGGSVSFTTGQVAYTTNTGSNGSVAQGVQQPYEISIVTSLSENEDVQLELLVYPNPTINNLKLKVESDKKELLTYELLDMLGKSIEKKIINKSITEINTESLPKSTYFLKVTNNNKLVKTFKIIKN